MEQGPGELSTDNKDVVDAKLAEGEFVIPANVVRFYGLDKFQKMIVKAEETMAESEAAGDMGGEPLPPDIDSADMVAMEAAPEGDRGFSEGGFVYDTSKFDEFNPEDWAYLGLNPSDMGQEKVTVTKNYVNNRGQIIPITFVDGKPTTAIPEGFYPEGSAPPQQQQPRPDNREPGPSRDDDHVYGTEEEMGDRGPFGGKNPFEMSREELLSSVEGMKNGLNKLNTLGGAAPALAATLGPMGGFATMGLVAAKANSIANINRAALVAEARGDKTLADAIRGDLEESVGNGLLGGVFDRIASGRGRFSRDREEYIGAGNAVTPYSMDRNTRAGTRSGGYNDPVSRSSRSYSGQASTSRSNVSSGGGDRDNDHSSSRSVSRSSSTSATSQRSAPNRNTTSSSGGLSFGNRESSQSRSRSSGGNTTQHSSVAGDFTSTDTKLGFQKGGLVVRRKK